jgi:two-component system chemotaxis response regulator CheY
MKEWQTSNKTKDVRAQHATHSAQEVNMPSVMITDDSLFIRNKLARLLVKHGYEAIMAGDGVEAVRVYCENRPDVVLMDVTMPRKDGLQALADIIKLDPSALVIIVTALDQRVVVSQAILAGARDYLTKPIRPDELMTALEKALN